MFINSRSTKLSSNTWEFYNFSLYLRLVLPLLYFDVLIGLDHEFVQSSTEVQMASFYILLTFCSYFLYKYSLDVKLDCPNSFTNKKIHDFPSPPRASDNYYIQTEIPSSLTFMLLTNSWRHLRLCYTGPKSDIALANETFICLSILYFM